MSTTMSGVPPTTESLSFWAPRRCLREPIPQLFDAARLLDLAVESHLSGNRERAARRIREADIPEVGQWLQSIWGKQDPKIIRFRKVPNAPAPISKAETPRARNPSAATKQAVKHRDGHLCRFCGKRVSTSLT